MTIGVLGPLSVRVNGEPVNLGGRRQSAVLVALLLVRGRVVSTDALIEAVWAGQPPSAPQAYVSHLRKRLEPDGAPGLRTGIIERIGPGYALRLPERAVDARRFESLVGTALRAGDPVPLLTEALALWRGAAVAGCGDEDWSRATAQRWTALRIIWCEGPSRSRTDTAVRAMKDQRSRYRRPRYRDFPNVRPMTSHLVASTPGAVVGATHRCPRAAA